MDSFNKIISFILGLVVVIVFLAVISRRIDLSKFLSSSRGVTPTVTVTPTPRQSAGGVSVVTSTPAPAVGNNRYQTTQPGQTKGGATQPTTIPATGSSTILIPLALSSLFAGIGFRNTGKR